MPIYEWQCPECGRVVEHFHTERVVKAPICTHGVTTNPAGTPMVRKISAPAGFVLKGEGFYKPSG